MFGKKCSRCCNPVKIPFSKNCGIGDIPDELKKIWIDTGEILIPESHPDSIRIKTFECMHYDKESGLCRDYDNRPDICKHTSCVDPESSKPSDQQYEEFVNEKFFKLK